MSDLSSPFQGTGALPLHLRHQLFTFFNRIFNSTYQVKCSFRIFIHFTIHDHIKTTDRFFNRNQHTFQTCKCFGHMERL